MNYKSYTTADYDIPIKYIFSCSSIIHPHDMTQATQSLYIDALYYVNVGIELIHLSIVSYTILIKNCNWVDEFTYNFFLKYAKRLFVSICKQPCFVPYNSIGRSSVLFKTSLVF